MEFMQVEDAIELIRMEYAEMPGLQLTFSQARRLWNLPTELCASALTSLTRSGFLIKTPDGVYTAGREAA